MKITGPKRIFFDDLYEMAKRNQKIQRDEYLAYRAQYEADRASPEGTFYKALRPLSYELIEAQVSTVIPPIRVDPERYNLGRARNALTLEKTIEQDLIKAGIVQLNDEDERATYIYGTSIWLIEWDETIKTHGEVGAPVISLVRPDQFIPQPGVNEVQRLEYCFLDFDTTIQECARKYDADEDALRASHTVREGDKDGYTGDEDSITVHVCYYRDDNGKVSEYVWTDGMELLDYEDIYSRRRNACSICGRSAALSEDGKTCACGGEIIEMPADYEELTHDIILDAGNVIKERRVIPAVSPVLKKGEPVMKKVSVPATAPDGRVLTENIDGIDLPLMVDDWQPKMEPTKIPWYTPTLLPIVARKNTSSEASIFGQSDLEYIKDIQAEYNKIKSRIYEKMMGSSVYPVVPERAIMEPDNTINQKVVRIPDGVAANMFGSIDTSVSIQQDLVYLGQLYDEAQRTLGITNSYLGAADTTAKSGKAKQIQVNQSAGRLESKRQMKYHAYCEIANIIFQYRLAYSDEPVPVKMTDEYGMVHYSAFNRYDYVEYDDVAGEWYYDDRYLFRVDPVANNEDQPEVVWESIMSAFQMGMYGNPADPTTMLRVWMMLQRAHYPYAAEQVTYLQGLIMQQQAMMAQQAAAAPGGIPAPAQAQAQPGAQNKAQTQGAAPIALKGVMNNG